MSHHPLDRPDAEDQPATQAAKVRAPHRLLSATHPTALRSGIITAIAGGVWAAVLGISTNFFPNDSGLETLRRCGLFAMLVGMLIVLFSFPTARQTIFAPLGLLKRVTRSSVAASMIGIYGCFGIAGMVLVIGCLATIRAAPCLPVAMMMLSLTSTWAFTGPRSSRPFFVGGLPAAFLVVAFTFLALVLRLLNSGIPWSLYYFFMSNDDETFLLLVMGGLFTFICGFVGLFAAWIADRVVENSDPLEK